MGRTHARKLNVARRQLSQEQRRELIRQQLKETPEKSDRQIAAGLGISHHTVSARRNELERTGQIAQLETNIGADGKERPRQVARKPVSIFNPTKREERAVQNPAVVERMAEGIDHKTKSPPAYSRQALTKAYSAVIIWV